MHPAYEMSASAFSPVTRSPGDEMSYNTTSADVEDDDLMPISVAVRLCPDVNQVTNLIITVRIKSKETKTEHILHLI